MSPIQEQYWRYLANLKYSTFYTKVHVEKAELIDNCINGFLAFVSASSIAAWAVWQKAPWLWALFIAIANIITAIKPFLPFSKRIAPLKATAYALRDVFLRAEAEWHAVSSGELKEEEINAKLHECKATEAQAWKKHVGELTLPLNVKYRSIADQLTADYFQQAYGVQVILDHP